MMILDYLLNGRSPVTTGDPVLKQNKNLKSTIKAYNLKELIFKADTKDIKTEKKITEAESWFFIDTYKANKTLSVFTKDKWDEVQIKDESGDIATKYTNIKILIR